MTSQSGDVTSPPTVQSGGDDIWSQLTLEWPQRDLDYSAQKFIISPTNEAAVATAKAWLNSSEPTLIICGPPQCGKTHLANFLFHNSKADYQIVDAFNPEGASSNLIILDDLPARDPVEFLGAFETAISAGARLVLVGRGHPADWSAGLRDLETRLAAAPRASLGEPDEALIQSIITKSFSERQITVDPEVVNYAVKRLPRTFEAALFFVEYADAAALAAGRKLTKPFVQKFMQKLSNASIFDAAQE